MISLRLKAFRLHQATRSLVAHERTHLRPNTATRTDLNYPALRRVNVATAAVNREVLNSPAVSAYFTVGHRVANMARTKDASNFGNTTTGGNTHDK